MSNLCLDIGNTRWKAGVFNGESLETLQVFDSQHAVEKIKALLYNHSIEHTIFSTVNQISEEVLQDLQAHTQVLELNHKTQLPIQSKYETPQTLGPDRIAAVMGIFGVFEQALVIDVGTCITYDVLTNGNIYQGGNISPGLSMRFKALNHFTGKLPLIDPTTDELVCIGSSTEQAIQVGVIQGILHEIEGFIDQYSSRYGEMSVIMTGGDSNYLVERLKKMIFVRPNLVLEGLSKILVHHVQNK